MLTDLYGLCYYSSPGCKYVIVESTRDTKKGIVQVLSLVAHYLSGQTNINRQYSSASSTYESISSEL